MNVSRGAGIVGSDQRGERGHHGNRRIASALGTVRQASSVEQLGAALPRDAVCRSGRNHPCARLGAGKRRLEVEHALQPGTIAEALLRPGRPKELAEQLGSRRGAHRPENGASFEPAPAGSGGPLAAVSMPWTYPLATLTSPLGESPHHTSAGKLPVPGRVEECTSLTIRARSMNSCP